MKSMIELQLKQLFKNKVMIMTFVIYPSLLTFIIGYLAENSFQVGVSSYEYYSNSMMIFIFMGAGLAALYNLADKDVVEGNLRAMYMPIANRCIYISQIISSTIFSSIAIVLNVMIFKILFGIDYKGNELIIIIGFIALAFLSSAIGMLLCGLVKEVGICNGIFNLIQAVFCLLGGAFISIEGMGEIPRLLVKLSPVKYLIDGIFNVLYDNTTQMITLTIGINIILGIVVILITEKIFKVEKYL